MKFPIAEFLRQCDAIKDGAVAMLNDESLLLIENKLAMAMMHVRTVRAEKVAAEARPKMNLQQRRDYLNAFVRENHISGKETYEQLEAQANILKRSGFYAMSTVTADIVYRLRSTAEKKGGRS